MTDYRFDTTWRLPTSPQRAWDLLYDGERWPSWWPSVREVEVLDPGGPDGVGRRLRYHFATRLPYTLTFEAELIEVNEPSRLVARAQGELAGTWTCDLVQDAADTALRHVWAVSTTKVWMNALAPLARPVFSWNHVALMREGGRGFAAALGTSVRVETDEKDRASGVATVVAAAAGAVVILRRIRRRH